MYGRSPFSRTDAFTLALASGLFLLPSRHVHTCPCFRTFSAPLKARSHLSLLQDFFYFLLPLYCGDCWVNLLLLSYMKVKCDFFNLTPIFLSFLNVPLLFFFFTYKNDLVSLKSYFFKTFMCM